MYDGVLEKIKIKVLSEQKRKKKGYINEWTFIMRVPKWAYDCWQTDYTYGHIQTFVKAREKLKRIIKKNLLK